MVTSVLFFLIIAALSSFRKEEEKLASVIALPAVLVLEWNTAAESLVDSCRQRRLPVCASDVIPSTAGKSLKISENS